MATEPFREFPQSSRKYYGYYFKTDHMGSLTTIQNSEHTHTNYRQNSVSKERETLQLREILVFHATDLTHSECVLYTIR